MISNELQLKIAQAVYNLIRDLSISHTVVVVRPRPPPETPLYFHGYKPTSVHDVFRLMAYPPGGESHFLCQQPKCFKLDVDLSDVPTRPCCGAQKLCCEQCWNTLAVPAISAIRRFFVEEEKVPATDLLFVFSGKKGYHVWVRHRKFIALTADESRGILTNLVRYVESHSGLPPRSFVPDSQVSLPTSTLRLPFSNRFGAISFPFSPNAASFENMKATEETLQAALLLI